MSDGVYNWKNDEVGSVLATTHGLPWIADLDDIEEPSTESPYGYYVAKYTDKTFLFKDIGYTGGKNSERRFLIADPERSLVNGIHWGNVTDYDVPYYGTFSYTNSSGVTKSVEVIGYTVRKNMPIPVRVDTSGNLLAWSKWKNIGTGGVRKFITRTGSGTNVFRLDKDEHYAKFRWDPDKKTVLKMFYTSSQNSGNAETSWVQDNFSNNSLMIMDIQAGGGGGGGSGGSKDDGMYDGNASCSCGGGGGGAGAFITLVIDLTKFHHIEIKTTAGSQYGKRGGNRAGDHDGEKGTKGTDVIVNFYSNESTITKSIKANGGEPGKAANADVAKHIADQAEADKEFAWSSNIGGGLGGYIEWTKGGVSSSGYVQHFGTQNVSGNRAKSGGHGGCSSADTSVRRAGQNASGQSLTIGGGSGWLRNQTLQNKTQAKAFGKNDGSACQGGAGAPSVLGHPGERDYNNADTYLTKPTGYGYGGGGGARNGYADTGTSWVDEGQDGGQACIIVYY